MIYSEYESVYIKHVRKHNMKVLDKSVLNNKNLRQQYDACVKNLLSQEYILAWFLKECTTEFNNFTIDEILKEAFISDVTVSTTAVNQDDEDIVEPSKLDMANSEDKSSREGTVYYDVRFAVSVPNSDNRVFIIVNIEAQKDDEATLHALKRMVYYASRLISAQKNKCFAKDNYENIRKVYSIWVQMNVPEEKQNTITKYYIGEDALFGNVHEPKEAYDLMNILVLRLGKKQDTKSKILRLLNILLKSKDAPETKKQILQNDYQIRFDETLEEGVSTMCNLSEGIYEEGKEEGREEGILVTLKQLVDDGILALKDAAERMKISEAAFLEKTAKLAN